MIGHSFQLLVLLSLLCVPIAWLTPRALALDAVALWGFCCLSLLVPATALWLVSIAVVLPVLLPRFDARRDLAAGLLVVLLVAGFAGSRLLPGIGWVGVAFFTLRALHVVLDWWMGRLQPPTLRESLGYFLFLPVLVAGPINRLPQFQHQLRRRRWDVGMFMTGAERFLLGMVCIRFLSGTLCTAARTAVEELSADWAEFWAVWALSAVEWVDLYLVFSGASHVALGIALMMGIRLEENFDRPWQARSLLAFWRRWHISLTSWVQDYVFRPLVALTRNPVFGLVAAMLVVGMWHAFSVYYLLWSVWQTLGILLSRGLRIPEAGRGMQAVAGPLMVFAWLSAARPVIGLLGVSP